MNTYRNTLEIGNAQILFRNFAGRRKTQIVNGRETVVNDEGKRNFTVILDPEKSDIFWNGEQVMDPDFGQFLADMDDAWNVTVKPGKEEGEGPQYRLSVAISYDSSIQPELYMIVGNKKVLMDAETIGNLDYADIIKADIVINSGRPYESQRRGRSMVKAWCNRGYFTIMQDRFGSEYDNMEG